jgi:hypothetical protein
MPSDDSIASAGDYAGNAGDKIFDSRHNDIDASYVHIKVNSGQAHVYLREAVWSQWVTRINVHVNGDFEQEVIVDSGCCDGDHRLRVWA